MPELGVATAAQIHLGLSSTNIHHDCDTCGSLYFDNDCEGASQPARQTDRHCCCCRCRCRCLLQMTQQTLPNVAPVACQRMWLVSNKPLGG
eukprot:COSAG06_NODE_1585_length_9012_cov_3.017615_5_plen_91_part_00